jgi:hypothetical protein
VKTDDFKIQGSHQSQGFVATSRRMQTISNRNTVQNSFMNDILSMREVDEETEEPVVDLSEVPTAKLFG